MIKENSSTLIKDFLNKKVFIFLHENAKIISRFLFTALFIGMAIWFIGHEKTELVKVKNVLAGSKINWIIAGVGLTILYILMQGVLLLTSFASIGLRVRLRDTVILFLKRNFISIFLPAGGVASMAFFNEDLEKKSITKTQIYIASSIYAFIGILSVVIVAVPAFLFVVSGGGVGAGKWYALACVVIILFIINFVYRSLLKKGILYKFIFKIYPKAGFFIEDIKNHKIDINKFLYAVAASVIIEIIGIGLVYVSMAALSFSPSVSTSIIAYIVVVIFMIISPFLRGLGAIEISMTYVLIQSGLSNVDAIAVTILFRFFEFWLPLLAGILSFMLKIDKLLMRILPAVLIFGLGILNIISVLTPALPERLKILQEYYISDMVSFSNSFVLIAGLFLLVTASFMLRGLRTSWWFALLLSIVSVLGHITKGIDYEESVVAILVILSLMATRREYYVKTNPRLGTLGFQTAILSILAVLAFGITGFYFLDKNHFKIDFGFLQSVKYTLQNFFLIGSRNLTPADTFARDFIYMIRISGFASISFLVYTLVRPYVFRTAAGDEDLERAKLLTHQFGNSSLDFFKTYSDKIIFAPPDINAFLAYRISRNFAVVLENPVAEDNEAMKKCIVLFKLFCYNNSLKEVYYRIPEEILPLFSELSMKSLFLGQEGIVDLNSFTLEGGEKKSIRNALNKITEQGYTTHIYPPPLLDGLIQKLRAVSDEWLKLTEREEIVFSQGMFAEMEIKEQTVISIENREEKIIAFLNIIPDFAPNEGTYDLLRKTADAPNGIMDYVLVELFRYFKSNGIRYANLGFAPMSGLDDPHNFPERSIKFAYEKIRSFSHYKGQRIYKEKFNPKWNDKYLIYNNDYDLLKIPAILTRVIKP